MYPLFTKCVQRQYDLFLVSLHSTKKLDEVQPISKELTKIEEFDYELETRDLFGEKG